MEDLYLNINRYGCDASVLGNLLLFLFDVLN